MQERKLVSKVPMQVRDGGGWFLTVSGCLVQLVYDLDFFGVDVGTYCVAVQVYVFLVC